VDEVILVEESKAAVALQGVRDGLLVCTDFGGGTFDTAVVDVQGDISTVLDLNGVDVGGEEFDAKIFDACVRPRLWLDAEFTTHDGSHRRLPALLRNSLRSLSGLRTLLTTNIALDAISAYRHQGNDDVLHFIDQLVYGGQAWQFYTAIEKAKWALSEEEETLLQLRSVGLDVRIPITRREFEDAIAADLRRVRYCLEDSLADAGVTADEVTSVTKTGGSSQIPAFGRLLRGLFPAAEIIESDPFTSVVLGLADYAREEWG
jgi:hypothetical chaperone protein